MLAILVVLLTSIALAPLSCIMLWGRYISFTDSLIHSCIFGGFISQVLHIDSIFGILLSGLCLWTIAINLYDNCRNTGSQRIEITNLYLISMFMSSVAIGFGVNYNKMLFGNLLFADKVDLAQLVLVIAIIYSFIFKYKSDIYLMSLDEDFARGLGVRVGFLQKCSLLLIIMTVSLVIKILGGGFFIVGAMLLPGVIAVNLSTNPSQMLYISCLISLFNSGLSIYFSEYFDIDFAPLTIILGSTIYSCIKISKVFIKKS